MGIKWLGGSGRPSAAEIKAGGAIPCHLNMGTDSDCYFGQGVYSDGICDEVGREISDISDLQIQNSGIRCHHSFKAESLHGESLHFR